MEKEISVLLKDNSLKKARLIVEDLGEEVKIKFIDDKFQVEKKGTRPFFVLAELRLELEAIGYLIVCNGSRIDVYPSNLTAVGFNAYQIKPKQKTSLDDLVNIFDPTDRIDLITTVENQRNYYNEVLNFFK